MDSQARSPLQHVPSTPHAYFSEYGRRVTATSPLATVPDVSFVASPALPAGEVPSTPRAEILASPWLLRVHGGPIVTNSTPSRMAITSNYTGQASLAITETPIQYGTPSLGSSYEEQIVPSSPTDGSRCSRITQAETRKTEDITVTKKPRERTPRVLSTSPRPPKCRTLELFNGDEIFA